MSVDYDLVILGGSAAGRYAAIVASRWHARVALIEPELPQQQPETPWIAHQTVLQVARAARQQQWAEVWGGMRPDRPLSWQEAIQWVGYVTETIGEVGEFGRSLPLLVASGVDVVVGQGQFVGRDRGTQSSRPHRLGVTVNDRLFRSRAYLLAPPSVPQIPQIAALETVPYLTLDSLWQQEWVTLPSHVLIVGGDPRAIEIAQALHRLGAQVTLVIETAQLLPFADPEVSYLLQAQLEAEGITVLTQTSLVHVRSIDHPIQGRVQGRVQGQVGDRVIEADVLLVAIGQWPDVQALQLNEAGVHWQAGSLPVNAKLQTANRRIYACGITLGADTSPHVARYEADIAVRNALFWPRHQTDYSQLPWGLFTDPEVVRVGLDEAQARQAYGADIQVLRQYFKTLVKAQLRGETTGLCKLIIRSNGQILGAHVMGAEASEWMGRLAFAVQHRLTLDRIAQFPSLSPTFAEILDLLLHQWRQPYPLHPKRDWLETWFNFRRSWSS